MTARQFIAIRRRLDLTQGALAKMLSVDVQTIARYDKGETRIPGPVAIVMEILLTLDQAKVHGGHETHERLRAIFGM
jgi:DNA-binding transcriptional regulator YiaG